MSKYRIGNYDTGEVKFMYLKIWKHMPERWYGGLIRRKIWIAKCINVDKQLEKKYYGNN